MNQSFFKKNTSLRITIALLLFIPLVVAVVFGLRVDPNTVVVNNLRTVTIHSPQGSIYNYDEEEIFNVYTSIPENAKEIEKDFRDFSLEKPYKVEFKETNTEPITYTLYVTDDVNDYVYIAPDGKYYLLSPDVAKNLAERPELAYVVLDEILPKANAGGFGLLYELSASSYNWTYTAKDGNIVNVNSTELKSNPTVKFDMSENGLLKFDFDKAPDSLTLTIENDSTVFFNDKIENLSGATMLAFDHDELLKATAVAEWYEMDDASFFGTMTYTFNLLFEIAPTYRLVDTKALPLGDFTVLRMSDFNDGEKLTVVNDIGIAESINVYDLEDENVKIAFIPLSGTLDVGSYTLTLKTDTGFVKDVTVKTKQGGNIKENSEPVTVLINEETDKGLSDAMSKEAIDEFNALIARLNSESVNKKLYEGKFEYPTGSSKITEGGWNYGDKLKVFSLNASDEVFFNSGMDLACSENQKIFASNNGTVLYADKTTLYGNTVIVDHGYGILSVYGNLSDIAVRVGDSVEKGTSMLGVAGSTGFACVRKDASATTATLCHYAVALNGVFVAPKSVYNGITLK